MILSFTLARAIENGIHADRAPLAIQYLPAPRESKQENLVEMSYKVL
jgi:hypothetical protein